MQTVCQAFVERQRATYMCMYQLKSCTHGRCGVTEAVGILSQQAKGDIHQASSVCHCCRHLLCWCADVCISVTACTLLAAAAAGPHPCPLPGGGCPRLHGCLQMADGGLYPTGVLLLAVQVQLCICGCHNYVVRVPASRHTQGHATKLLSWQFADVHLCTRVAEQCASVIQRTLLVFLQWRHVCVLSS
jgi:hypothetical protein